MGENCDTRRETCPTETAFTTNSTQTGLEKNPGFLGGRRAANLIVQGTASYDTTFNANHATGTCCTALHTDSV